MHNNNQSSSGNLGFGSSNVPYSTNLATYPRDVYEVMLNPLPFNARGFGQRVAATENLVILGLVLTSLRNLRILPRAAFARPYVMLCTVYTGAFLYTFAALGNLGLIQRERVVMLPFLLVLLVHPTGPRGARPRYDWELRWRGPPPTSPGCRRQRPARRQPVARR